MTLDENIEFLKNQTDFFTSVKKKTNAELDELQSKYKLTNAKLEVENEKLSRLREDINDINGATKAIIREKLQAEMSLKDALKLKETQRDLNEQITSTKAKWGIASGSLKKLREDSAVQGKERVLVKLESIIKGNLKAVDFKHSDINSVSISRQTLRPEQEGYDIVAETSASDYIRIIWSYTLALLELAGKEQEIKHGGFVVFDEPRQHEASKISFASLIGKASESASFGGQAIFATSLDQDELEKSCADKGVNLVCFDDYILKREKDNESTTSDASD